MASNRDPTLPLPGFALVSEVGDVARALRNLSGLGIDSLISRLTPQRATARRIDVQLASGETLSLIHI